jgi:molybdopterin synthase catalytic subunit
MIRVQAEDFDIGAEIDALLGQRRDIGAVVTFTGLVRDFIRDADAPGGRRAIAEMTLEHYPGMTERELARIEAEARRRWPLDEVLIVHRHGPLAPGARIVLVVTVSSHRQAAFAAAEFLVDWLKTRAPFWKRETTAEGAHWVAARAEDDAAAARWAEAPTQPSPAAEPVADE